MEKTKILMPMLALFIVALMTCPTVAQLFEKGFDEYGYNYQAHTFIGWDQNAGRPAEVYEGEWGADGEWWLVMRWNDAWLSNKDRDDDGKLDRHWGYPNYYGSGAWLTNFYLTWYLGSDGNIHQATIFGKIVAQDYDGHAEDIGATEIWTYFMIVQEVWNDPYGEAFGMIRTLVAPCGFGQFGL